MADRCLRPLIVAVALLQGCAEHAGDPTVGLPSTTPPATQRALTAEQRRAVDVARAHVAAANAGQIYGEEIYEVQRHGDGWIVRAEQYPQVPGGHWVVQIDRDGNVLEYHRGR